ncbi:MAG TPA: hypothetical protein V6C57_17080 [Coleofasciculaceae cyanobacterium]
MAMELGRNPLPRPPHYGDSYVSHWQWLGIKASTAVAQLCGKNGRAFFAAPEFFRISQEVESCPAFAPTLINQVMFHGKPD